jgi:hypothetical protein
LVEELRRPRTRGHVTEGEERAIMGALRSAIHAHGPITLDLIFSATKRIVGNLRNVSPPGRDGGARAKEGE